MKRVVKVKLVLLEFKEFKVSEVKLDHKDQLGKVVTQGFKEQQVLKGKVDNKVFKDDQD